MSGDGSEGVSEGAPVRRGVRGGRAARRAARSGGESLNGASHYGEAAWNFTTYEMGSEEVLAQLEYNADTILEEVGVDFRDPEDEREPGSADPHDLFREAGCEIGVGDESDRVRFPRGLARKIIQESAPSEFMHHARNSANSVIIGGRRTVFSPVYGPPFIRDLEGNRRYAMLEDFENLVKLIYMSPALHYSGGTVCEPTDVPVNKRHLDMLYAHARYSDKPFMGSVTHWSRARDSVAMAERLFGAEFVEKNTVLTALINVNSPLVYDATMLGALKVYAERGQGVQIAPFVLAGAMAPCTAAGCISQILAEAQAGMSLCQLIRPGSPVIFGSFVSSMSMQSGAPTMGTPEPSLIMAHLAQLARRLGVPFRTGGALTASKVADMQAAYESAATLWVSLMSGINLLQHAAGWLEGGLSFSYEKLLMDCDQISAMHRLFRGLDMSENGQAMETLLKNPPGQHHLGTDHTQNNFKEAFWISQLSDNNSFEQWSSEGALDATARANGLARSMLLRYEAPPIDVAVDESLRDFMAQRKSSMADAWSA
ncbi:MAG: trimethylamine methyltransferase family protein [Alphaproteobacteria bacterium]